MAANDCPDDDRNQSSWSFFLNHYFSEIGQTTMSGKWHAHARLHNNYLLVDINERFVFRQCTGVEVQNCSLQQSVDGEEDDGKRVKAREKRQEKKCKREKAREKRQESKGKREKAREKRQERRGKREKAREKRREKRGKRKGKREKASRWQRGDGNRYIQAQKFQVNMY